MTLEATPNDILAAIDVLDQLAESSDHLTGQDAVAFVDAIDQLTSRARFARDMLAMRLVSVLREPVTVEGRTLYFVEDNVQRRDDHAKIAQEVVDWACVDRIHGVVIESPKLAAARAVGAMLELYTSPSTTVKVSKLDGLGITREEVINENKVEGRKLTKKELRAKE